MNFHLRTTLSHVILLIFAICEIQGVMYDQRQINNKIDSTSIMYGSTIRIKAIPFNYYLHSHQVYYPMGSGSQSVTGFPADNDYNSLWTIKEAHGDHVQTYQQGVKCGDTIRLEHALTKKNLHSQEIYQSMITKNQEVCAFGNEGHGNDNDNWIIKCLSKGDSTQLAGGDIFEIIHENTEKKLKMSKYYEYSFSNWQNCPFQGQIEVSATEKSSRQTQFKIVGGVFFRETAPKTGQENDISEDL